jgi:hypothetical protein
MKTDDCSRQRAAARQARQRCAWLKGGYRLQVPQADRLIKKAAVTFLHGYPTPAPDYIKRIEWGPHGFQLPFGANKFLIARVYLKAEGMINYLFDAIEGCKSISRVSAEAALEYCVSSSVSNYDDEEYNYPVEEGYLKLGGSGVDVRAAVDCLIHDSGVFTFLEGP